MLWFPIECGYWMHRKFIGIGSDAIALWLGLLAYSNQYRTDGKVELRIVDVICRTNGISLEKAVSGLYERNLAQLEPESQKVVIINYLDHQQSRNQIEYQLERNRKKSQAYRKRNRHRSRHRLRHPPRHRSVTGTPISNISLSSSSLKRQYKERTEEKKVVPNHTGSNSSSLRDASISLRIGFDAFYAVYPRKRSPAVAWRAWQKIKPDAALCQTIMAAVETQKKWPEWSGDPKHIPYPASWLNAKGWENQPDKPLLGSQQNPKYFVAPKDFKKRCQKQDSSP